MTSDAINYLAWIVGFLIAGILFLNKKAMWFADALSAKRNYDPNKVNLLIGWSLIVFAVACVPAFLDCIFNIPWLSFFSLAIFIVILVIIPIVEFGGKLNK